MASMRVVNVVATASLNQRVDPPRIGKLPNVRYDPNTYGGRVAYVKTSAMKGKVSVFDSGKMISVGTTNGEDASNDLREVKEMLVEAGMIHSTSLEVRIQNIVATADFGKPITLERVAEKLRAVYEPEQFPGAIVRIREPYRATALLFASGQAVILGTKSLGQLDIITETLFKALSTQR